MAASSGRRTTVLTAVRIGSLGWSASSGSAAASTTSGAPSRSPTTPWRAGWAGGRRPTASSKTWASSAVACGRWASSGLR
eukprot:3409142-Alexandrium_andersonii.AAC.1